MTLVLTSEEFDVLRSHLARAAGLSFDDSRRESMAYSVAERLRGTGAADVASYLGLLTDPTESQLLLDEVTIQETHFFRNPPQVRALRDHVVPELLRYAEAHGRRLRIWSAGCSTGEEPYTLAMVLRELLPNTQGWDVKVIATDISARALEAARRGCYGDRAVKMASPQDLARFFTPTAEGGHEVRQEVRDLVEFRHHNLVTEAPPVRPGEHIDLILCRNVTIYFARDTTRALVNRLHASLREGGYLCLGHSETLWQVSEDFQLLSIGTGDSAAFVYRRLELGVPRRVAGPERSSAVGQDGFPAERRAWVRQALGDQSSVRLAWAAQPTATLPVPQTAAALLAAARTALAAGHYPEAAQLAWEASAAEPLLAEPFYLRGQAFVDAGRDADALIDLRKAVYLNPLLGFAHFLLAGALDRLGHADAAAREYTAAADTLGVGAEDASAPELGGRSVRELAGLCRQLGQRLVDQQVEEVG